MQLKNLKPFKCTNIIKLIHGWVPTMATFVDKERNHLLYTCGAYPLQNLFHTYFNDLTSMQSRNNLPNCTHSFGA